MAAKKKRRPHTGGSPSYERARRFGSRFGVQPARTHQGWALVLDGGAAFFSNDTTRLMAPSDRERELASRVTGVREVREDILTLEAGSMAEEAVLSARGRL